MNSSWRLKLCVFAATCLILCVLLKGLDFVVKPRYVFKQIPREWSQKYQQALVDELKSCVFNNTCSTQLPYGDFKTPLHIPGSDRTIIPLANIPNRLIVSCNEWGKTRRFVSDEQGFDNPSGIWSGTDFDLAFVGDSFVSGYCVPSGEGFVDKIRNHYPSTLNLGVISIGPLQELAVVKEYLLNKHVKYLFWVFFEGNDLQGIQTEGPMWDLWKDYLSKPLPQSLIARQKEANSAIDLEIKYRLQHQEKETEALSVKPMPLTARMAHASIPYLSDFLFCYKQDKMLHRQSLFKDKILQLEQIAAAFDKEAKRLQAKIIFMYLPDYMRITSHESCLNYRRLTDKSMVLDRIKPHVDAMIDVAETMQHQQDPMSFFPQGQDLHYNEQGYWFVANEVIKFLDRPKWLRE